MHSRVILVLLVAATCPLAAAAAAEGHEHHKGHKMDPAKAALAELGATAVFDTQGTLWAAHKDGGVVVVSRSKDLGKSWSKPVRVTSEPEATDPGGDARPKIAVSSRNDIFVTWTRPLSKPHTGEIRFARSLDGGRTFLPPMTVHADRQEITHRFDTITLNRDGQIFIAWIDKRDQVAAAEKKDPAYRGAALYYAVSDDRGENFRGDFKVADYSCECCRISLVPKADGTVVAMWRHIFAPNVRDHAFAVLHSNGESGKVERASFDDWSIDACPHAGPAVAVDGQGQLHGVWFTGSAKNPGAYYGRLNEKGIEVQCQIGTIAAERPDVAATGRRVAVAWKEFDGERTQLLGMVSEDSGNSWKRCHLASTDGPSDHPRIVSRGSILRLLEHPPSAFIH